MPASSRFAAQPRVTLPGSERKAFSVEHNPRLPFATPEVESTHVTPKGEHLTISVIVRPKTLIDTSTLGQPGAQLTHEQFEARYGADPASVDLVKQFAEEFGLQVEAGADSGRRTIHLTGSVAAMEKAFGTTLKQEKTTHGTLRVREGALTVPQELVDHVTAVLGLDNRPQAKPHSRVAIPHATNISYTPVQVAQLYNFPNNLNAAGQTIGIIELGGGYRPADIDTYFRGIGLNPPVVSAVSVDKGKNKPGNANGADGEVMLDIEVAGAVAQGATLAVYFAPNTDQGFLDAITTAVHDTERKPGVISISWGGPESSWTQQSLAAMDQACQAAAALGITITVACGDSGSTDGVADGQNHVDFPASSPHVLACGGTTLRGANGAISSEVVWNELAANEGATGGGVSDFFALPSWQANAGVPAPTVSTGGRGLPDVSGDADPATGYNVRVDGEDTVIGGTSAVAPLWAGLIALSNAKNGAYAGFANPQLYGANEASTFHDITSGTNGAFNAAPGWDACTGLGSPVGTAVAAALKATAGTTPPTTPTTPTGGKHGKHHHSK